jgi:Tfp pilus assembly protein PilF
MPTHYRPLLALAPAVLALLAACATPGDRSVPEVEAPASFQALLANADTAQERGDLPAAARDYRRAAQASEDEMVADQATRFAYENHQYEEAALAADRWLELNPSSETARRYAGVSALRLHRLDVATGHFELLLDSGYISRAAGFLALAPILDDQGTPADVTELLWRLADSRPEVAEGHYAVGNAALRSDNSALALARARKAVELAPYWVPAKLLLARVQIASGDEDAGLAAAAALADATDADLATRLEYAFLLLGTGRTDEARARLTPYVTGQTVVPSAIRALGLLELQSGNLDGASEQFQKLLATGAADDEANLQLGGIAERRKDAELALRHYQSVGRGESGVIAQQRIARLKAEGSGLEAGLAQLQLWGESQPQTGPDYYAMRAALASSFDDEKRALAELEAGLLLYPRSVDLRLARAYLYERTDRVDAALREMRALLEERPGDAVLQNALGYTLADRTRRAEEARPLIEAALAQTPDSAAVQDSMGWVLHKLGRNEEGLVYLRKAREGAGDPEIDYHIGEVQWALGQRDEARRTWAEALERHPEDTRLLRRLERAGQ